MSDSVLEGEKSRVRWRGEGAPYPFVREERKVRSRGVCWECRVFWISGQVEVVLEEVSFLSRGGFGFSEPEVEKREEVRSPIREEKGFDWERLERERVVSGAVVVAVVA